MTRRHTYETTVSFGADGEPDFVELEVKLSFSVAWGSPESGRFGRPEDYDPGAPDEVEDIRLETVEGEPAPFLAFTFASDAEAQELIVGALTDLDTEAMLEEARAAEGGE